MACRFSQTSGGELEELYQKARNEPDDMLAMIYMLQWKERTRSILLEQANNICKRCRAA